MPCRDPEGLQGVKTSTPGKLQKYRVSKDIGPLKITKLTSQHSMLGHHRLASRTPFKWPFAGGPLMACLYLYLDPSSPHQTKKKLDPL